jgi:hypothetical protein
MRFKSIVAVAAAFLSCGIAAPRSAEAFGWGREAPAAGWGAARPVEHWVYYPRYHHLYRIAGTTDPYAYVPSDRGYYPYHNSGYWRPAAEMRHRFRYSFKLPKYHRAWGYPRRDWNNEQWHHENHGFHHRWHW